MLNRENPRIIQLKPEGSFGYQETGVGPALTPWQLITVNREDSPKNSVRETVRLCIVSLDMPLRRAKVDRNLH